MKIVPLLIEEQNFIKLFFYSSLLDFEEPNVTESGDCKDEGMDTILTS